MEREVFVFDQRQILNTLTPRQIGRHFPDGIFKCIQMTENVSISIEIPLKFVPKGSALDSDLAPAREQGITWRMYASLGLNELNSNIFWSYPKHIYGIF